MASTTPALDSSDLKFHLVSQWALKCNPTPLQRKRLEDANLAYAQATMPQPIDGSIETFQKLRKDLEVQYVSTNADFIQFYGRNAAMNQYAAAFFFLLTVDYTGLDSIIQSHPWIHAWFKFRGDEAQRQEVKDALIPNKINTLAKLESTVHEFFIPELLLDRDHVLQRGIAVCQKINFLEVFQKNDQWTALRVFIEKDRAALKHLVPFLEMSPFRFPDKIGLLQKSIESKMDELQKMATNPPKKKNPTQSNPPTSNIKTNTKTTERPLSQLFKAIFLGGGKRKRGADPEDPAIAPPSYEQSIPVEKTTEATEVKKN